MPLVEFLTTNTCEGESNGSISLVGSIPNPLSEYEFSLDGTTYTNDIEFNNLAAGPHTIFLLEDGVCQFQFPANIETQPVPSVMYDTEDACIGEANGSATMITSDIGLEYSIDQINFFFKQPYNRLSSRNAYHLCYGPKLLYSSS